MCKTESGLYFLPNLITEKVQTKTMCKRQRFYEWTTLLNPGLIDAENPLKGFHPDVEVFQRIGKFHDLPFDSIGSTLK